MAIQHSSSSLTWNCCQHPPPHTLGLLLTPLISLSHLLSSLSLPPFNTQQLLFSLFFSPFSCHYLLALTSLCYEIRKIWGNISALRLRAPHSFIQLSSCYPELSHFQHLVVVQFVFVSLFYLCFYHLNCFWSFAAFMLISHIRAVCDFVVQRRFVLKFIA